MPLSNGASKRRMPRGGPFAVGGNRVDPMVPLHTARRSRTRGAANHIRHIWYDGRALAFEEIPCRRPACRSEQSAAGARSTPAALKGSSSPDASTSRRSWASSTGTSSMASCLCAPSIPTRHGSPPMAQNTLGATSSMSFLKRRPRSRLRSQASPGMRRATRVWSTLKSDQTPSKRRPTSAIVATAWCRSS